MSKVSTGVRTIALRLVGTEEAQDSLTELGEEIDEWVVMTNSEKQQIIKDYTAVASNNGEGFDILDENGNYKDTYEILLGIAEVYKEIQEEDEKYGTNRATALIEEIAGKNRSNIAASILSNPDILVSAYESSQNATGSAAEENEKYLQSVQGHLDVLSSSFQNLWANAIDPDVLSFFIQIGTNIINLVDNVGLLNSAIIALAAVGSVKGIGLFDFTDNTSNVFSKGINDLVKEASAAMTKLKNQAGKTNIFKEFLFGSSDVVSIPDILSDADASDIIQKLKTSGLSVEDFLSSPRAASYTDSMANALRKYGESCEIANMNSQGLVATSKNLNTEATKLSTSFSSVGLLGKLKSVGGELLTIAGNMAVAYAASMVFSLAFNAISSAIDDAIHHTENLIEAGQEASDTISSVYDEYNSKASTIDSSAERYGELMSGVDTRTNKNISLTNDEYEEYLTLCNDIAEIYPELVTGYTEQGDAILNLGTSAETATKKLYALLEADKTAANFEIADNLQTAYEGAKAEAQQLQEEMDALITSAGEYQEQAESLTRSDLTAQFNEIIEGARQYLELDLDAYADLLPTIRKAMTNAGISIDTTSSYAYDSDNDGIDDTQILQFMGLPDSDQIEAVMSELEGTFNLETYKLAQTFSETSAENLLQASSLQKEIDAVWSALIPSFVSTLETNPNYSQLTDEVQAGITEALSNIDFSSLPDDVDITSYLKETFLYPISGIFNDEDATDVQQAINDIFTIDTSELTAADYEETVSGYLQTIKDYYVSILGEEAGLAYYNEFVLTYGFSIEMEDGTLQSSVANMKNTIVRTFYQEFAGDETLGELLESLTVDQMQAIVDLINDSSWGGTFADAYEQVVATAQQAASTVSTITFSSLLTDSEGEASEFSESIDTFQSDIDSINEALESLRSGEEVSFTDLVQEFPELTGQADNLEEALSNLSVDKLKEFADTWEDTIEGLEGDELEVASQYFNELLKELDFSDYDLSEAYNSLYSQLMSGRMDSGHAKALTDQLWEEYGDSEVGREAILKLSLNPDSANWTYEEWVAAIEDQEVSINLALNEENIEKLNNDLANVQNSIATKENSISLKEAKGEAVTESDYRTLIRGEQEQIQIYKDLIAETEAEQENLLAGGTSADSTAYQELSAQIQEYQQDIVDCQIAIVEYGDTIDNLPVDAYDNELERLEAEKSSLEDAISLKETLGQTVVAEDYQGLIDNSYSQIATLEATNEELRSQQVGLDETSEKWLELQSQIESNEASIRSETQSIAEWEESIRNLPVDELNNDLNDLQSTLDGYQDEIDLKEALGLEITEDDYQNMIDTAEAEIAVYEKLIEKAQAEQERLLTEEGLTIDDPGYREQTELIESYTAAIIDARISMAEWADTMDTLSFDNFSNGLEAVWTALQSQQIGASIDYESFTSTELQDYQSALEYVNGTLQLNIEKVSEIAEAKAEETAATVKANKAAAQAEYKQNAKDIQTLQAKLKTLDKSSEDYADTLREIRSLQSTNSTIASQCTAYDLLTQSIYESISAYQDWVNIQDASDYGDMFSDVMEGYQLIYDTLFNAESDTYGQIGSLKFQAAVEMLAPEDLDTSSLSELEEYFGEHLKTLFTYDLDEDDGTITFDGMDIGTFLTKSVEAGLMTAEEAVEGTQYEINPDLTMGDFMEALNISETAIQAFFDELGLYGGDFDWSIEAAQSLDDMMVAAGEAANSLSTLDAYSDLNIVMDVSDLDTTDEKISALQSTIDEMNELKVQPDVDDSQVEQANAIITYCLAQIQDLTNPIVMSVDTSTVTDEDLYTAISLLQQLQEAVNTKELNLAVGADTSDADAAIASLTEEINGNAELMAKVGITVTGDTDAADILTQMDEQTVDTYKNIGVTVDDKEAADALAEIANMTIDDKNFAINADTRDAVSGIKQVISYLNNIQDKSVTVTTNRVINTTTSTDVGAASGTAHAMGTAFASGNWGTKKASKTLVGELGTELIVNSTSGKWYTVGEAGPEFVNLPKNAIVFNHLQTQSLLEQGFVSSRGKALASGTALASGNAAASTTTLASAGVSGGILYIDKYYNNSSSSTSSSSGTSTTDTTTSSDEKTALEKFQEWFSKLFDWIEIKLEYMTNKIDKYISKAESYLDQGRYSASARNYRKAIKASTTQIDNEEQAEQLYTAQAEEVLAQAKAQGLVNDATIAEIKTKIANGSMEISEYSEEIQEVISSYSEFTTKAQEAADAVDELSQSILTYIDDLKALREAQRDARLDTSDTRTTIGTSTLTYTVAEQNSQLQYTNTQLQKQNNAYSSYVSNMQSDLSSQAKTAESAVTSAISSASPYNKLYIFALQQVQAAIANGTELPEDYVKIVKQYGSASLAAQLDAYSESYSNYETAKQEAALAYAENSASYVSNIQEMYQNRDDAYEDRISLYTQQASNADSAEDAIALYEKIDSYYQKQLDNDLAEIEEYNSLISSNTATLSSDAWKTSEYTSLSKDSEIRERVREYVRKARQAAKAGEYIPANVISNIEMYWEEGYISDVFYQACLDYQNALAAKEQAEAAYDMDVEEIAENRSNLGDQAYAAVQQEQENKLQENSNKIDLLQAQQNQKTSAGVELTEADYQAMAELYKEREELLNAQRDALQAQRDANVAAGWWTESSQEYIDATNDIAAIDVEIVNCVTDWEELNAAILALPLEQLEKAIDLLEAYQSLCSSILDYTEATGKLMTAADYWEAWNAATVTAQNYLDYANMALSNYQQALASEDGTYGNKSAAEWYKEYFEALSSYNSALAEAQEYTNDMINVPFETIDNELGAIEAYQSVLEAMASLKETQGWSLDVGDYADQMTYLNYELAQLQEKAKYAYNDYLEAYANGGEYYGYYGGKTTKEWLEYLYEIEEQIYATEEAQEELNNAIAQIPYDTIEAYLELLDAIDSYHESSASLKSALGEDLSEADYTQQIKDNNDQLTQLYEEYYQAYEDYEKAVANGGVYGGLTSDEWLTRYYDLGTEINSIKEETEQLKDELRDDVYWRTFERAHEECENLQDVLEGLADLIDEDMYFDVDGNLTDFGVAQIGNLVKEWETAQQEVKNYSNDIENLNQLYEDGWYTQEEYKEKLAELQEGVLDAASSMKDAMDDIIDMLKNESELELNSILDVIDARNQALSAKKSYYDFDKSLKDSNKNIEQLQSELAALQGVETAEARALAAQKEAELAEAVEDRDELLLEHSIELSQTALDDLSELMQENFDNYWDNVSSDMDEMINLLSAANSIYTSSAVEVVNTLNKLLSYYGIDTSSTGTLEAAGYASGTTSVSSDQLAWTQEDGTELIIRKSDGAILTPLNTGDAVLTAEQSERLVDLVTSPNDLISSSLSVPTAPTVEVKAGSTINQNYDALIRVDGNVDSTVISDLESFAKQFYEGAYNYTVREIARDAQKVGIKARR